MNYLRKHHENKRLLRNYVAFLNECTDHHSKIKLCAEITRLNQENKSIEKMPFEEARKEINTTVQYVNSLI